MDTSKHIAITKVGEELGILEDMQSMHLENPDADLEDHFGWEHKLEYDAEDGEHPW